MPSDCNIIKDKVFTTDHVTSSFLFGSTMKLMRTLENQQ